MTAKKPDKNKPGKSEVQGDKPAVRIGPIGPIGPFRPPAFINLNPTISSWSPVGAVVGGAAFTLIVFGSNFTANSSVLWNNAARATTFVSSTQLTAEIAAADIAAISAVPVMVSKPGVTPTAPTLASNVVTFNVIPDISSTINQLRLVTQNPANLLDDLTTWVTLEQEQVDNLTGQVNTDDTAVGGLQSQVANLNNTVAQQANTISTLQAALAASKGSTASPLDVAQSFKSVVDSIQQQARDAGGVQTTLTNMNIQLKTLISVQAASGATPAQAVLGFVDPTAPPDPNLLSTMTLAFGAIPNVKPASGGAGSSSSSSSSSAGLSSSSGSSSSSSSSSASGSSSSSRVIPPPPAPAARVRTGGRTTRGRG